MAKLVKSSYESYVYLIGYGNKIKIGKANRPNIRLSQLQVGITNLTVNERFLARELKHIKVLKTEEFPVGRCAYTKEQRLLKLLSDYRYTGEKILTRGDTEIVTVNPLHYLREEFDG